MQDIDTKARIGFRSEYALEADFAEEIGVTRRTVGRYRNEPDGLPYAMIGGKVYIPIKAGRDWIASRIRQPNPRRAA